MSSPRPLVILAGWLGCQPRSLRRYEELYRARGMQVLRYIAPPSAIFQCTLPYYTANHKDTVSQPKYEMDELVDRMLADLEASGCTAYLFHCFSNGGCFVYERFRQATSKPPAGIIMDSCPGFQIHRITIALDYCTWTERLQVAWNHARYYARAHNHDTWQPHVKRRADEYHDNLLNDPWLVPQLYLYSRDDPLMPYDEVAALAKARKERGVDVHQKLWDNSRHCAHLIDHPEEYEQAVDSFIQQCLLDARAKF